MTFLAFNSEKVEKRKKKIEIDTKITQKKKNKKKTDSSEKKNGKEKKERKKKRFNYDRIVIDCQLVRPNE